MVLMHLAGCSALDIAKEFHLSEEGLGAQWKAEVIDRLKDTPTFAGKDVEMVQRAIGARTEVMMGVVGMIEEDWGGIKDFLRKELHIPEEVLNRSKQILND